MPSEGTSTEHNTLAALEKGGQILTQLAREGKLRPTVAWADDIERVFSILCCHTRGKNPFLLGPRGYCRTAIVEGLALLITGSYAPEWLKNRSVLSVVPRLRGRISRSSRRGTTDRTLLD